MLSGLWLFAGLHHFALFAILIAICCFITIMIIITIKITITIMMIDLGMLLVKGLACC